MTCLDVEGSFAGEAIRFTERIRDLAGAGGR